MKKFSVWDLLTILILVATITLMAVFWSNFTNPGSALNPFPNPTSIPTIVMPSQPATITIVVTETSNESAIAADTATSTEMKTATSTPSATNTVTGTISITSTPTTSSTPTITSTATKTSTPAITSTPTRTSTATRTGTVINTATKTLTSTSTKASTYTATLAAATLTFTPKPTSVTNTPVPTSGGGCDGGNTSIESAVLSAVNYQREQAGVASLQTSSALFSAARGHSQDMATNNFFSHTGSNGSSPFDRMSSAGFSYSAAAENIYAGNGSNNSAGSAVGSWMGSEGHRVNMLNPSYTYAGVGYWCNSNSEYDGYFTLNLARP